MTYEDTYEWSFDGQFLRRQSNSNGELPEAVSNLGVEPATNEFKWWDYGADGSVGTGSTRQVTDGIWIGQQKRARPSGTSRSRGRLRTVDEHTIEYTIVEQSVEGDAPQFPELTIWKRKR